MICGASAASRAALRWTGSRRAANLERRGGSGVPQAMSSPTVRPLDEADLDRADAIFRLAFGTHLGLPDPMAFAGDSDFIRSRWRSFPDAAFAAEDAGVLLGTILGARWGSVGFFGPLTVDPTAWNRGVAQSLLEPMMERFASWNVRHAGLYTFSNSPKHVNLYRRFGFQPRFLTALMARPLDPQSGGEPPLLVSGLSPSARESVLAECRAVTDALYDGLDLAAEIESVRNQGLGDTVLVAGSGGVEAFAVCHTGAGSEAGSGECYVKFAAVSPTAGPEVFVAALEACERYAAERGATRLETGVSTAREEAYGILSSRGYRTEVLGVTMHRPNEPGYSRPGLFVLDDWR